MDEGLINRIKESIAATPPADPNAPPADQAPQQQAPAPAPAGADFETGSVMQMGAQAPAQALGAIVGGARDALQNTVDTARKADSAIFGIPDWGDKQIPTLPEVPRADEQSSTGTAFNMVRDLERFVLGFVGGQKVLKGFGVAANTFKGATGAGAIGDFAVTGANDPRLTDFFEHVPAAQGPILEALRSHDDDSLWQRKLMGSLEGVFFGSALEGVSRFVGIMRRVIKAGESSPELAQKVLEGEGGELETALKEIQAWHGSPHDFEAFQLGDKVGTGEGTSAFGHGVYVAENKKVAEYYRDYDPPGAMTMRNGAIKGEGNLYGVKVKHAPEEMLAWDKPLSEQTSQVSGALEKLKAKYPELDVAHEHGVLWDTVKAGDPTGEELYQALEHLTGSAEAASKALSEAGVPGLRFLDANSRGNTKAALEANLQRLEKEGSSVSGIDSAMLIEETKRKLANFDESALTHNMVLFDPKSAEVVSKNGERVAKAPPVVTPSGQIEMFPEVVRREEAIKDIQLAVKGERWIDPETGKEKILPISNRAREELLATANDPNAPVHLDKLTPETREELINALSSDSEAARFFSPKTVRGRPFALDDTRRAEFNAAVANSLTVPYATLKAEAPGTAIEDVLSSFFNYRYMDSPDTVKVTLDQMAEAMRPQVEKHLGGFPQTFDQVKEMADWFSMRPETLLASLSQLARFAEHMPALAVAGKVWEQSLSREIRQISMSIANGTASDTAMVELLRRVDVLGDLTGTLKSVQTAGARTTNIGRIRTSDSLTSEEIAKHLQEVGRDNVVLLARKLSLTEGDPKSVISLLEPGWVQKAFGVNNEFWINAVLSGTGTHIINLVTGLRNTAMYPLFRITGGLLTGDMRSVQIGLGQYAGLRSSIFDSLEMARRSLVTENAYVDAAFHQVEREKLWIKADTFNLSTDDILGKGVEGLGLAIRMPSRFLTSEDEFMKQINYRASVISRAKTEAYERGLSDTKMVSYFVDGEKRQLSEVDEYVRDRMNEAFHPRLEHGTDKAALDDARRATFTRPLGTETWGNWRSLGEAAQEAAARMPWLRSLVLPFVRVPTNIMREMIYESPLAPFRAQWHADFQAGGEKRADAVGRMALGTVFWTGTGVLAGEGLITGKGPTDPQLNKQWRGAGNEPYSIRFPGMGPDGKDLFISYNRFDPAASVLGIAADFAYISAHVDERTRDQLASTLAMSLANNLNSRSYLRGLSELMGLLGSSNDAQGPSKVQRWLNSRASSYVPRIVSSFNPDDTMRDARSMLEAIESKIPGLSPGLPPMRDNFGEPIVPAVGWPYKEVNPFTIGIGKSGPARKELSYWAESPVRAQFEMPHSSIDGVIDLRDAKNTQTGQSAYDRWLEVLTEPKFGGKTAEERMNDLVQSEGYRELKKRGVEDPIFRRHPAAELLRDQLGANYKTAQQLMLQEPGFEDLRKALAAYHADKMSIPAGASPPPNATLDELLKKR